MKMSLQHLNPRIPGTGRIIFSVQVVMNPIKAPIISRIDSLSKPALIGISGFGGSGKSTIAGKIGALIKAPVIGVDAFFNDSVDAYNYWNVFDYERLEKDVLIPFTSGDPVLAYREYDWEKKSLGGEVQIKHNNSIIVEGVGLFRPSLMKYFSLAIWIDCSLDEAIRRGKTRDREEYGHPQDEFWDGIWKDNDLSCYREYDPKSNADLIINHEKIGDIFIA